MFLLVLTPVGLTLWAVLLANRIGPAAGAGGLVFAVAITGLAARRILRPLDHRIAQLRESEQSIRHSQADLDRAYLQFVETMAQALDARDPYTAGHSIRVGAYSYAIALELGLPASQAETIRIAARLHDIGKIGIPDAILQKPDSLTPEEYGLVKLHPQIGRRILSKVSRFEELLPVVELHHENHDGTGYPYKLSGDRIPLDVRIVHVADAFDAMTTNRSYRAGLPLSLAIEDIRANSGSQFDPEVVEVFLRLIASGRQAALLLVAEQGLLALREVHAEDREESVAQAFSR